MELSYWRSKWRKGKIGFHMENGYPGLEKHWKSIGLQDNPTVLVPLCGKSKDLLWLSEHCSRVVGVEISQIAVEQFFKENSLDAKQTMFADFTVYRSKNIEIWNGDFQKLPKHKLPSFDLVYDKAALIALPPDMRKEYAVKIIELCNQNTHILMHQFEYRQDEMNGPPFSVSIDEVKQLFGGQFHLKILDRQELNLDNYKKFQNRGLRSYFIDFLSLLLPKEEV